MASSPKNEPPPPAINLSIHAVSVQIGDQALRRAAGSIKEEKSSW